MPLAAPTAPQKRGGSGSGYTARSKIYPRLANGTFRNVKWAVMAVTLGIYYLLPWIRWDRGPGLPDQAILLDFANQRLLFGPIEIWAQEFYYVTGPPRSRCPCSLSRNVRSPVACGAATPVRRRCGPI